MNRKKMNWQRILDIIDDEQKSLGQPCSRRKTMMVGKKKKKSNSWNQRAGEWCPGTDGGGGKEGKGEKLVKGYNILCICKMRKFYGFSVHDDYSY